MPREFPKRIQLSNGLRPQDTEYGDIFLEEVVNLRQRKGHLYPVDDYANPITNLQPFINWPFPQLHKDEKVELLADSITLYSLSSLAATAVSVFKARTAANAFTITTGTTWQFAGFDLGYFLSNGTDFIFKVPSNDSNKVLGITNTGANSLGFNSVGKDISRLILGSLDGDYWTDTTDFNWDEFFQIWRKSSEAQVYTDEDLAVGDNWFLWYEPTDINQPFALLLSVLSIPTAARFTLLKTVWREALQSGQIGLVRVPTRGKVMKTMTLGNSLIVYTDESIWSYAHTDSGYGFPARVIGKGILGRGCAGGDEQEHVFLDSEGTLYKLTSSELNVMDYREYIADLTLASIDVVFREIGRQFYISDGVKSFILTTHGLTETQLIVTSFMDAGTSGEVAINEWACALTLGSDTVNNGGFGSDTIWDKTSGFTITGGALVYATPASSSGLQKATHDEADWTAATRLSDVYEVIYECTAYVDGRFVVDFFALDWDTDVTLSPHYVDSHNTLGKFRHIVGAIPSTTVPADFDSQLFAFTDASDTDTGNFSLDNISVKKVTTDPCGFIIGKNLFRSSTDDLTKWTTATNVSVLTNGFRFASATTNSITLVTANYKISSMAYRGYRITYTVENYTVGDLSIRLDDNTPGDSNYDNAGAATYTVYVGSGNGSDIDIIPNAGCTLDIVDITIDEVLGHPLNTGYRKSTVTESDKGVDGTNTNAGDFLIVTNPVDMSFMGVKAVNFIEVRGIGLSSLNLQVDYRYGLSDSYIRSPIVYGTNDGVLWAGVGGVQQKYRIGGRITDTGRIESILVRYQYADNRSIHGFRGGEAPIPSANE